MQRVIFLVDMNAFFISCEMTRNNSLIGIAATVAADPKKRSGIILAAHYEARSYGVKTTMVLHQALIQPSFHGPQISNVAAPHGIQSIHMKIPIWKIRSHRQVMLAVRRDSENFTALLQIRLD